MIILLLVITGCSNKTGIKKDGKIILHLTKSPEKNTTCLMTIGNTAETDWPRSTEKVLSMLTGYRVRIKGNNVNIIKDAFFEEGKDAVSLSISIPEGNGYIVQVLALGANINGNSNNKLLLGAGQATNIKVKGNEDNIVTVKMKPYKFDFSNNQTTVTANLPFSITGTISGPIISEVLDITETNFYYYRTADIDKDAEGVEVSDLSYEGLDSGQLKFNADIPGLASGPFYFQLISNGLSSMNYKDVSYSLAVPCISVGEQNKLPSINIGEPAENQKPVINITKKIEIDNRKVTIRGSITDNDGSVEEVVIDWGDGNSDTITSGLDNINETHTYPDEDNYIITITATDDAQVSSSEEIDIGTINKVITFADDNLEQVIREKIEKPTGDIYKSEVIGITKLSAFDHNISSIEGIQHLENLEELYLGFWKGSSNTITDITPLSDLYNLRELDLSNNQIEDISPLSELTNLYGLGLRDNQISDITPLSNLTNLTWWLHLHGNQIEDISPLSNLTELKDLELSDNLISDINPLSNFTRLTDLKLQDNQISDIDPLSNLTKLERLWLISNSITDIYPLSGLTNLTELWLTDN